MAPGGNPMDSAFWRIAELGSRYSDPRWAGDRARTWAALEEVVARAGADVADMVLAMEAAEDRMRNAEAREQAARRQRDRHRSRASALSSSLREANSAAEAALARTLTAEREVERATESLHDLKQELDQLRSALTQTEGERDELREALASARAERDEATGPVVPSGWDESQAPRAQVPSWWKAAPPAPPVAEPVPSADDVTVEPEAPGAEGEVAEPTALVDLTDRVCRLSVHATPGRLLPDDFGALLIEGAEVVRRDGRLAVMIAVTLSANEWSRPGDNRREEQAARLREEGFGVEFIDEALAS